MWIKWKYNDHGWPDFKELEVPDEKLQVYGSVPEYLEESDMVPTWSERYSRSRIEWKKLKKPSLDYLNSLIESTKSGIKRYRNKLQELESLKYKSYPTL